MKHRLLALTLLLAPAIAAAGTPAPDGPGDVVGPVANAYAIPSIYAAELMADDDGPRRFSLGPASPNPFRGTTQLVLTVDTPQRLTAAVFDALGRRVALLHDGPLAAGSYPLTFDAAQLPPGLYVIRVTDGQGGTATRAAALAR
jgi:hypothetical protein